jgi:hypothetical protein
MMGIASIDTSTRRSHVADVSRSSLPRPDSLSAWHEEILQPTLAQRMASRKFMYKTLAKNYVVHGERRMGSSKLEMAHSAQLTMQKEGPAPLVLADNGQ